MYSKHSGRHTLWFDKYDPLKTGNTVEEKKKEKCNLYFSALPLETLQMLQRLACKLRWVSLHVAKIHSKKCF